MRLPIVLFFVLSSLSFVTLGQFVGTRLEIFRARSSALWGYALDLGGSLLGVIGFAARFKVRPAANLAFGWNLLGAVLGGLTEFFSMAIGLRALMLVAVIAYLASFLLARRGATREAVAG